MCDSLAENCRNWTTRGKTRSNEARRGEAGRDATRRDDTRRGAAKRDETRYEKKKGKAKRRNVVTRRENNTQPTRVPARRRLNSTAVARHEREACLRRAMERDQVIGHRGGEGMKKARGREENGFHRVRQGRVKG